MLSIIVAFASANVLRDFENGIERTDRVAREAKRDHFYKGHKGGSYKGGHHDDRHYNRGHYKGGRGGYHKGK